MPVGIRKTFTVAYPDEPYKTTTALGNSFECTYVGPRYLLIQVDNDDHEVREAGRADVAGDPGIDPAGYEQDEYSYVVLDASASDQNALICAYITDEYTHPDVPDYSEEITDADGNTYTWEHVYEGTTGMLPHIYWNNTLKYNPTTETWTMPTFREHVNSRESVMDTAAENAAAIRRALADSTQDFTADERTKLDDHASWLESLPTRYEGINHWKIPYPEEALPAWEDPDA